MERLRELGYPVSPRGGLAGGYRARRGRGDAAAAARRRGGRRGRGRPAGGRDQRRDRRDRGELAAGAREARAGPARALAPASQRAAVDRRRPYPASGADRRPGRRSRRSRAACRDQRAAAVRLSWLRVGQPAADSSSLIAWSTAGGAGTSSRGTSDRDDWRTFRVDRVNPRTPGGRRFTPRPLPAVDIADWVARRVATGGWQHRARVTVFAPAAAVSERIGPYVGTVTAVDDQTCVLDTGSDSMTTMAVYSGLPRLGLPGGRAAGTGRRSARARRAVRARAARSVRGRLVPMPGI